MVVRGGENVYPAEVENIFRHPAVQEVQVFGVPDTRKGEEVCAWIVLASGETVTEEDITFLLRPDRPLQSTALYSFRDALPMTVTASRRNRTARRYDGRARSKRRRRKKGN